MTPAERSRYTARVFPLPQLLPGPFLCEECAGRLSAAVGREPGVVESVYDPSSCVLRVAFDPGVIAEDELAERVSVLAREAAGAVEHTAYRVTGLD